MNYPYPTPAPSRRSLVFLFSLLLLACTTRAQAPAWSGAVYGATSQASGGSGIAGIATDASGNVFVAGYYNGTMTLGGTVLTSLNATNDLFVAKYVPGTNTWAWAVSGGGTGDDFGGGIAVSGSSVYVVGSITNTTANTSQVAFGGSAQAGASTVNGYDIVLVKYTDNGTTATFRWSEVGGGTLGDTGNGVAVSGTSVYLTGGIYNNSVGGSAVVFGGSGTTPGNNPQFGASSAYGYDVVLAKYTDNGSTATLGWTQVAGGTGYDYGTAVAASGTSVYVTGDLTNSTTNANAVVFGGAGATAGTSAQAGASASAKDALFLAKYQDNGTTATFRWSQVGGGSNSAFGRGVGVSGTSVYVTGNVYNNTANANAVVFGGTGTTLGTSQLNGATATNSSDLVLAKYTDNGTTGNFGWGQVAGGTGDDYGFGVAVSGSSVVVTGYLNNNAANANAVVFGGSGTTAGTSSQAGASAATSNDLLLARYQDNGTTASFRWSQVGGGTGTDQGYGVAISGQQVYAGGVIAPPATFGPTTIPAAAGTSVAVLARLTDAMLLATRPGSAAPAGLYPNPASGAATLSGAQPGAVVQVLDALGRVVATATADASGTAALAGLAPGVYVVRAGSSATRLVVQY